MRAFFVFIFLFAVGVSPAKSQHSESNSELWVVIKLETEFKTTQQNEVINSLISIIEDNDMGFFDGASSGGYQLELNFYEVLEYDAAEERIRKFFQNHYPNVDYQVSESYETTFETP